MGEIKLGSIPSSQNTPSGSCGRSGSEDDKVDNGNGLGLKQPVLASEATLPLRKSSISASSRFLRPLVGAGDDVMPVDPAVVEVLTQVGTEGTKAPIGTAECGSLPLSATRHQRESFGSLVKPPISAVEDVNPNEEHWKAYTPLPSAAMSSEGQEHLHQSDRLLNSNSSAALSSAPFAATSSHRPATSSHRPRTSVGSSKWSQELRLHQHAKGRSRLAPATRTAGGRWGTNHGQLHALFSGEEFMEPPLSGRGLLENSPWVLDVDSSPGSPR